MELQLQLKLTRVLAYLKPNISFDRIFTAAHTAHEVLQRPYDIFVRYTLVSHKGIAFYIDFRRNKCDILILNIRKKKGGEVIRDTAF